MNSFYLRFLGSLLMIFSCAAVQAQSRTVRQGQHVSGELLVQVEPGMAVKKIVDDLAQVHGQATGLHVKEFLSPPMNVYQLAFDKGVNDQAMLVALKRNPAVSLAQFNHYVFMRDTVLPNDPEVEDQWQYVNDGSNGGTEDSDIDADQAWGISTGGLTAQGDTIVVCVIEGGDFFHDDLAANRWINHQEIAGNHIDDDNNGYVDDYAGWNVESEDDEGVENGNHGTAVMGMIGAVGDNDLGGTGINWNVKIMSVAGENINDEASVVEAYTYPLVMRQRFNETNGDSGAFVVATNASWGIDYGDPADVPIWCAFYDSLGTRGILNCGATTNSSIDVDVEGDIPTACPSQYMVSVTATDNNDVRTFSGYGVNSIDVGAPGDQIYTTEYGGGYGYTSGTSFASPLTAGVIGLLYSVPCNGFIEQVKENPQGGADLVRQVLFQGVDTVDNLGEEIATGGRINAYSSLLLLKSSFCGDTCLAATTPVVEIQEDTLAGISLFNPSANNPRVLRYKPVNDEEWIETGVVDSTAFLLDSLEWCTTYEVQAGNRCSADSTLYSPSVQFSTRGCCRPPEEIVAEEVSYHQANVLWSNDVLASTGFTLSYRPEGQSQWQELTDGDENSWLLTGLDSCMVYHLRVFSQCADSISETATFGQFRTPGCGACLDLAYCPATGGTDDEFIDGVEIGPYSNESGDDGGYALVEEPDFELMRNAEYDIELTPGYHGFPYPEYFRIWVDANQDGQFTEDERYFDAGEGTSGSVTGTIQLPGSALTGKTRLRVVMKYSEVETGLPEACQEEFEFGEVEDYCLTVNENSSGLHPPHVKPLTIYPNPASTTFTLVLPPELATSNATMHYTIYDALGRVLGAGQPGGTRTQIPASELESGIYLIRLTRGDELIGQSRLIRE